MLLLKLAIRNITHAGIRTWLNVLVLSVAFVSIVVTEGLYDGISEQVRHTEINTNIGGGQYWQKDYDPLNPFSYDMAHSVIPAHLNDQIKIGNATPQLIIPATIYPRKMIQTILIKGINPDQQILMLSTNLLNDNKDTLSIPAFIGPRMAESSGLKEGDVVTVKWRNVNHTFDAADIRIVKVLELISPLIDKDQIWIPFERLNTMIQTFNHATIIVVKKNAGIIPATNKEWIFKDENTLLKDIIENINRKKIYSSFVYIILIGMALLAVFDTQVLSIFKRKKEMGTLMALGMTKTNVVGLITLEGCITGLLSFVAGSIYGIPLLTYLANNGIELPRMVQQSQFALGLIFYPKYGIGLYFLTAIILFISVIIVSYLPARKITKLNPNDALKGKMK
jgi:ABC-type lipoprotein release transport system permease subunit